MTDPNTSYDAGSISSYWDDTPFCALSTFSRERINSRFMLFASERELNVFYLLTARSTLKVEELQANPSATLSVLSKADEISDYTETTVIGTVTLHDEFPSAPVQTGLGLLAKKSTMIQAVLDNGSLGDYVVLVLRPAEIVFRKYRDVLANAPKTILRF